MEETHNVIQLLHLPQSLGSSEDAQTPPSGPDVVLEGPAAFELKGKLPVLHLPMQYTNNDRITTIKSFKAVPAP